MLLPDDLLWYIFMRNASDLTVPTISRLETTQITSQVCQRWRDLILGSPSIWGRLILIDNSKTDTWIQEVLRRAGPSSLIWVHIYWMDPQISLASLFTTVVTQNWDRIEVLDISIHSSWDQKDFLSKLVWTQMANAAPKLRSFSINGIRIPSSGPDDILPEDLFAGHAPLLKVLECKEFSIGKSFKWSPQIETLYISLASVHNLHDILKWTPHLRILHIARTMYIRDISTEECSKLASLSSYILPRLATISVHISFEAFNALWCTKSKSPTKTKTSHFIDGCNPSQEPSQDMFQNAVNNLFYHSNINVNGVRDINCRLSVDRSSFAIDIMSFSQQSSLAFSWDHMPLNIVHMIFHTFMPNIVNVSMFSLYVGDFLHAEFPLEEMTQLCQLLATVKDIQVHEESLRWYNRVQRRSGPLFPLLQQILSDDNIYRGAFLSNLTEFLQTRLDEGWSLPIVHITSGNNIEVMCGIFKHNFHGLRVRYYSQKSPGVKEYVCGESESFEE